MPRSRLGAVLRLVSVPCLTSDNGHSVNEAAKAAALDHNIPLPSSFPVRGDNPCLLHPLERIAQGSLWLERGADLLCAEAFRMLPKQCQYPLAHGPTFPLRGLAWCGLARERCVSNVTVSWGDYPTGCRHGSAKGVP